MSGIDRVTVGASGAFSLSRLHVEEREAKRRTWPNVDHSSVRGGEFPRENFRGGREQTARSISPLRRYNRASERRVAHDPRLACDY